MEFLNEAIETQYAAIIAGLDLQAIHEARYSWPVAVRQIKAVAPDLTQANINELVPVVLGLAFTRCGYPGGIHAVITG